MRRAIPSATGLLLTQIDDCKYQVQTSFIYSRCIGINSDYWEKKKTEGTSGEAQYLENAPFIFDPDQNKAR